MRVFAFRIIIICSVMACVCLAAPEPAVVPGPGIWTLNTVFTHPQQIVLQSIDSNKLVRFWYVILTITNKTNQDVGFYPKCDLMTDTFQIIPAGMGVPALVFEQIKRRHQEQYPFLEQLEETSNRILQGEDNTKDIAVIWQDFDAKASGIKIFISGLSNETIAIDHPVAKDKETGRPIKVYLRKTLELNYALKSDAVMRSEAGIDFKDKCWIMR